MCQTRFVLPPINILILVDSHYGLTAQLAKSIAMGATREETEVIIRTIDDASAADIERADAVIVGSPNWSGITGKLKSWFDGLGEDWESGLFAGKFGAVFVTGYSRCAGMEMTLVQIMHLLLANGMILVGLPWDEVMVRSGSYWGATGSGSLTVTDSDRTQAERLGYRVAEIVMTYKCGEIQQKGRAGD